VLTEHDVRAGLAGRGHDDVVTLVDHALDTHGADTGRAGTGELREPYGVPYRCLLPVEFDNLAVASRGASFSSVAASSCRLSRAIMQLGQAAGTAAALALGQTSPGFAQVNAAGLRRSLREQQVQLEWPIPPDLLRHLREEPASCIPSPMHPDKHRHE
jgi:hypothetical protein